MINKYVPTGTNKRKYNINDDFLINIGPIQAWVLGMYASDGHILEGKRAVSISQSYPRGLYILQHIKRYLQAENPILTYSRAVPRGDAHVLRFTSPHLVSDMSKFGINREKTFKYRFPSALPSDVVPEFLRGYLDGDGYISVVHKRQDRFSNHSYLRASIVGTNGFIDDILKLPMISHGSVRPLRNSVTHGDVLFYGSNAMQICQELFRDDKLPKTHKYSLYRDYVDNVYPHTPAMTRMRKIDIALKKLKEGVSGLKIAEEIGVTTSTIYRWRDKYDSHS